MDNSSVIGFNNSEFFFFLNCKFYSFSDWVFFGADTNQLIISNIIFECLSLTLICQILCDCCIHPFLIVNLKLVLKAISPMIFVSKELHAAFEIIVKESLSNIETLKLVHGLSLLLSLDTSIVKCLIFDFDPSNFFLNLRLPFLVVHLSSLMIFVLKLSNFLQFVLFFDF